MKFHSTAIEQIIELVQNYGGSLNEQRLRVKLAEMNLTPYEQKSSANGKVVLIPTEVYEKELRTLK